MSLDQLISRHPPIIADIVRSVRSEILRIFPDSAETFDDENIGFGFEPGYKKLVFVITPYTKHVNLGIAQGASIEDPAQLMTGSGKVHRHVKLHSIEEVKNPALLELIKRALQASGERLQQDAKRLAGAY